MTTNNTDSPVKTFDFAPGLQLRTINKDAESWFIASDVCKALGLANVTVSLKALDADEQAKKFLGPDLPVNIISEAGLYRLVMRSTKPAAKPFQKWVTSVVLPTLRKDGIYIAGQEAHIAEDLTLPELFAQMADIQVKVDAMNAAKVRAWSRHQEEKEARSDAFRFFKGKAPRTRLQHAHFKDK